MNFSPKKYMTLDSLYNNLYAKFVSLSVHVCQIIEMSNFEWNQWHTHTHTHTHKHTDKHPTLPDIHEVDTTTWYIYLYDIPLAYYVILLLENGMKLFHEAKSQIIPRNAISLLCKLMTLIMYAN